MLRFRSGSKRTCLSCARSTIFFGGGLNVLKRCCSHLQKELYQDTDHRLFALWSQGEAAGLARSSSTSSCASRFVGMAGSFGAPARTLSTTPPDAFDVAPHLSPRMRGPADVPAMAFPLAAEASKQVQYWLGLLHPKLKITATLPCSQV